MKNRSFYLIVVIALGLHACIPLKSDTFRENEKVAQKDYLVYQINEDPKQRNLFFYDPINHTSSQILADWNVNIDGFSLSANNRLAFSSSQDGNSNIYILDYPFMGNTPTKITFDKSVNDTPISWSPDGHYLLLDSFQADGKKLSLWDGKNFLDIYDYHGQINEITWSAQGHLAFTEFSLADPAPDVDEGEVYIWDGNSTVSASQNPSGNDRFPAWSKDGRQLAFLSNRNGKYNIFLWDGISKKKNLPDVKTFVNVAPGLPEYFSSPTWTSTNSIAFSTGYKNDEHAQIYEWDGKKVRNISQNPLSHNGGQTWRNDGDWAFTTFFSKSQDLYIRDNNNRTLLETRGQYSPAWSQKGLLIFCAPDNSKSWTLSMWNNGKVISIAHGDFVIAKWNNGEFVFCSYG